MIATRRHYLLESAMTWRRPAKSGPTGVRQCDACSAPTVITRLAPASGFNVYPNGIEGVVAMHPDVLECACIGVPDEPSAEAPHLFVVLR